MRVLVTGAGGFAGQHLCRLLLQTGAEVVGTTLDGDPPAGAGGTLDEVELRAIRWVPLDVTGSNSVGELSRQGPFDQVYHLAGQSSVGDSFSDPVATWEVNATGTLRLLLALERAGWRSCRVLVVSSAEVYGVVPMEEQPVQEARTPAPLTPYGASKLGAEVVALHAAAMGRLDVVIARSFNHAGPGQDRRFIFPSLARQLALIAQGADEPVLRVGNLEARRDFLDVRDVSRAYVELLRSGESGAIYNVCSGRSHSLKDLVDALVRISGTSARIVVDPHRFRPADIPELRGDPRRLLALGWKPQKDLSQTLSDLYAAAEAELRDDTRAR